MSRNNDNWNSSNGSQRNNDYKGSNRRGKKERADLPKGYLEGGYFNDPKKEKLKPEYIVEYPKELAKDFGGAYGNNGIKRSQIRKYYEYLLRVEKKMENSNNDFSMVEADLQKLIPMVTYAKGRGVVTKIFEEFIEKNVETVRDQKDLEAFVQHFESVVAFTKEGG